MSEILRKQFLRHVAQTSPAPQLIEVARAEGVFFYTPEGKPYYDLVSGVSVNNVGHGNKAVVEAVQRQVADYMHIMVYGEMVERPQVEFARTLAEALPEPLDSVYFLNSGAEAVEGALKLAKRYTHRTEMISMRQAYHGSTHGAMSMMGTPEGEEWKNAFRPLLPDTKAIRFNCEEDLQQITERTACVLCEPVQGEAGVRPPKDGYLQALRKRCTEVGALLIFDEIQVGMGRTGEMFAMKTKSTTTATAVRPKNKVFRLVVIANGCSNKVRVRAPRGAESQSYRAAQRRQIPRPTPRSRCHQLRLCAQCYYKPSPGAPHVCRQIAGR